MDPQVEQKLKQRAASMLPPAVMMCIECRADATGDQALYSLLDEAQQAGLDGRPLCAEPCETIVFADRVLLRCGGCPRAESMPHFIARGRGKTAEEAHRNALYALTLPPGRGGAGKDGCLGTMRYGEGPVKETVISCPWVRCAWAKGVG